MLGGCPNLVAGLIYGTVLLGNILKGSPGFRRNVLFLQRRLRTHLLSLMEMSGSCRSSTMKMCLYKQELGPYELLSEQYKLTVSQRSNAWLKQDTTRYIT